MFVDYHVGLDKLNTL